MTFEYPIKKNILTVLQENNLRPLKQLGQNFLIDKSMAQKIAGSLLIEPKENVLEIGPGLGAMTSIFLNHPIQLTTIEIDRGIVSYLNQKKEQSSFAAFWDLIHNDILLYDWELLFSGETFKILSNVPYSITGCLLIKILNHRDKIKSAVLLLQEEIIKKMIAPVNSKDYNRISVYFGLLGDVSQVSKVPKECFFPQPKVHSGVVHVTFNRSISLIDESFFFTLVQSSFRQRRKTIANNLRGLVYQGQTWTDSSLKKAFEHVGLSPTDRPQNISPTQYLSLAKTLKP
ncbi:ribosomal RNA small subunit methyltransferase A [PVC group bacterium (ex Bugula neritina AB1)]|nr:ribosomal RNA small subunit methyltransferase A [PVC group bacterium (ex Bugula neritina AB1)]